MEAKAEYKTKKMPIMTPRQLDLLLDLVSEVSSSGWGEVSVIVINHEVRRIETRRSMNVGEDEKTPGC